MNEYRVNQIIVFILIYVAYGSTYLLRMPYSVTKDIILNRFSLSAMSLGYIDIAFLLPYAAVSLTLTSLVDNIGSQITLCVSMIGSALSSCLLPHCDNFLLFLFFIFVSGCFQALCWPASCSLISATFGKQKSSSVFGLFGTCCFVGAISGKCLAVYLKENYSFAHVFQIPAAIVLVNGIFVLLGKRFSKTINDDTKAEVQQPLLGTHKTSLIQTTSPWKKLFLPGVLDVSFTFFFVKYIRYTFMFWLPLYMEKALKYSSAVAGYGSLSFDIGGVVGTAVIGFISDRFTQGRDMLVCLFTILGFMCLLTLFWVYSAGWFWHITLLTLAGSLNGGCDILLCGAVAAKLGTLYSNGDATCVTAFAGIVNGFGSLGTVLEGPIVSLVSYVAGWESIVPLILVFSVFASYFAYRAHTFMSSHVK